MLQIFSRIQENSALASILQQTRPSLQSLDFCEKLLWFLTCEQEAEQKGIEHFYFPKQTSLFTHVSAGGIRGRNSVFLAGSSLNTSCTQR